MTRRRRRVAILGGGLAGLSAAYELTRTAARRAEFEVTLYQLGWRLGGKAASGRGPHGRVQEHGLHLFFGFYDNAFSLVRGVYDEVDGGGNLPSWQRAFVPQHSLDLWHRHGGELHRWCVRFPRNDQLPGDPHPPIALPELLERAVTFSFSLAAAALGAPVAPATRLAELLSGLGLGRFAPALQRLWRYLERRVQEDAGDDERGDDEASALHRALEQITRALHRRLDRLAARKLGVHRAFIAIDWALAVLRGVLRDGLASPEGWRRVDHLDYKTWLKNHGADDRTINSVLVRAYYSAVLAVPEDRHIPVAAGTALRTQLRMFLTYRGAFLNKIRAGLGDCAIAPLYKILSRRGVDFRFFHEVTDLVPDRDNNVARVLLKRQARLRGDGYDPLVRVRGLDSWPAEPRWEQLTADARRLGARRLERTLGVPAHARAHGDALELRHGRDYDQLIFAIPLGAVPTAAPSLLAYSPRWRAMIEGVRDIATQSFQLWLRQRPDALGWRGEPAFSTTFRAPVDTWADVSFVLEHEDWPPDARPEGLLYFTGFLDAARPGSDARYVARQDARARETMVRYVRRELPRLYPGRDGEALLHSLTGQSPLASQYVTANVEPWERYVLACPGTNEHRLPADDTGFRNLAIAGDWIANGVYSGCAEGAVIGGMQAARALGCAGVKIQGEHVW